MLLRSVSSSEDLFTSMTGRAADPESPASPPQHQTPHGDTDDDVWGPPSPSAPSSAPHSDIPRLRQEHATAGYRDGVTAAKARSAQPGFDEGFPLGAALGARAGRLLGLVEGLAAAAPGRRELLGRARAELSARAVLAPEFWAADGTWRYEVPPPAGGGEPVFADVAAAHPLLSRWEAAVAEAARQCGLDLRVLADDDEPAGVARDAGEGSPAGRRPAAPTQVPAAKAREALQW